MNIQRLYEASLRHKNSKIASIHYKLNKGIVNVLYPIFGKCEFGVEPSSNVIISLTSYPARIKTVHLTIMTLLNQTVKPKSVVLWLASEQFPNGIKDLPVKLTILEPKGLKIRFCDDLRSHKKYYYAMKDNPESYVITVDDDVYYPENLVETLIETSAKYPDTVVCTWGHEIFLEKGDVYTADKWQYSTEGSLPSYELIPTGVGGVLYPPHSLSEEVFNKDAFKEQCINADDLWLKAMALLKGTKAVRVDKPAKLYFSILSTQKEGLYYDNAIQDKNSIAWKNIMEAYPKCREVLIESIGKC
ncbi:hypothetical protein [Butyrivibrio proteoclasticus]|uniref:hypothetical protein n=1 Tax=Butyrivibrio proteoclasticus TaxID=43305 RepID=UPI0006843923|nr:hypothetical protein [Butyrivibrio proteoclasticus]